MNRDQLIEALNNYHSTYKEELQFIPRFLKLLTQPNCYKREFLSGHLTGSAWILDRHKKAALLTHHRKLNKWLQLGGHADGNENILEVALTEAKEESGLKNLLIPSSSIFDIDIHQIPKKATIQSHLHYDIRFLFFAEGRDELKISHESIDLQWVAIEDLADLTLNNKSIMRMAEKSDPFLIK